ncbi:Hypp1485 [Branchiostoma lanceolatum]|nr:Hypp1485 [Branchiostoma lanceolatum]
MRKQLLFVQSVRVAVETFLPCFTKNVMEALVLVLGVLSAGLSAANPPRGLYTAEGVEYVGCFEHGQPHQEQVLEVQIAHCTSSDTEPCLVPATCIDACQNASSNYIYVGLKYPGQCFCDSVLRGVNQTDSVEGIQCDGRCPGDLQLACGASSNMLVYLWTNMIIPPLTTSPVMITYSATVSGPTTKPEVVSTTTYRGIKHPTNNTGLIAGVTVGGVAFVGLVVTVVLVYMRRK